jgi:GH25 family lysozyme M1 (1,4-beta-N-acetylmuramidase)
MERTFLRGTWLNVKSAFTRKVDTSLLARAVGDVAPAEGLDVSQWSVISDAAKAVAGQSFCIFRARDGYRDDSKYATNLAFAKLFPIYGTYVFFNPRWAEGAPSGETQAAEYINLVRWNGQQMPLVLDLENSPNFTMPLRQNYLNELKPAVDRIFKDTGRRPIVYSNLSFFNSYLKADFDEKDSTFEAARSKAWLRACPLWIANPSTVNVKPALPTAWSNAALWQWALDVVSHPGLSVCDKNRWPGTLAQLQAWCKNADAPLPVWGQVTPPPPPPPPPPDPEPDPDLTALTARVSTLEIQVSQLAIQAHARDHTHTTGGPV